MASSKIKGRTSLMSANAPILITAGIVIVLAVLACYALFTHSINRKREQQRQRISALKSRTRKIEDTVTCFPPGYLGGTLNLIIQEALVSTLAELCKLQPTVPEHKGALEQANSHLMALNKQKAGMALKSLSNPRQIAGTRKNLKLLSKFFDQLAAKGSLNGARINEARMIIKNKMVLLATDEYDIQARNALGSGKHQLAAHYYTQANNILTKHNSGNTFNDSIRNHKDWIGEATKLAKAEQERLRAEKEALEADSKKWDDSDWKKKNFYD